MPWPAKKAERALGERDDGRGLLVGVDLGVGQAAVVVDHRVTELPAHPHALLGAGAISPAGQLVARAREAPQALGVHLQQVAGARPLKPTDLLTRRRRHPRHAATGQAARHGRVRHLKLGGDQPRAPARPRTRLADAVMHALAAAPRLMMWRGRAILGPRARRPLTVAGRAIAPDPVLHRRDAHAPPGRGLPPREPSIQAELDELDALPARQPPTLVMHPG